MRIAVIYLLKTATLLLMLVTSCCVYAADRKWNVNGGTCYTALADVGSSDAIAAHVCAGMNVCGAPNHYVCSPYVTEQVSGNATVTVEASVNGSGQAPFGNGAGLLILSSPANTCPEPKAPHPVVLSRGEKYYQFEDARRGGLFPLVIDRTYRSNVYSAMKPHGNWDFTYLVNRAIGIYKDNGYPGSPKIFQEGGKIVSFAATSTSSSTDIYHTVDKGVYYTLIYNKTTTPKQWEFTRPDGYIEIYNDRNSTNQRVGWLKKVINPQGLSHSFVYADATTTVPAHVDMTDDQTLKVLRWKHDEAFNPLELDEVNGTAETWIRKYTWDNVGRLDKVFYADETPGTDEDNFAQKFLFDPTHYSPVSPQTADDFKFLITGIDEQIGTAAPTHYSSVTYDNLGRVKTSALLNNSNAEVELSAFMYNWTWSNTGTNFQPKTRVTKTFPYQGGTDTIATDYAFTTHGAGITGTRVWDIVSVDGNPHAATGCAATSTATVYSTSSDPEGAGFIKFTQDARGYRTGRLRDAQGRVKTLETNLGPNSTTPNNDSRKTVTTYWNNSTTLPASITSFGNQSGWQAYKQVVFTYYSGNNRVATRTEKDISGTAYPDRVSTYHYWPSDSSINITRMIITDPENHSTVYDYDSSGRIASISDGTLTYLKTTYANYNTFGLPESITDANNVATTLVYDVEGRLKSSTTAGITTTYTYKPNGLLDVVTQADGSWLEYFYNSAHQLTGITNNFTENMEFTPSILDGQWTDVVTSDGTSSHNIVMQQHRLFDALGRLWKQQDANTIDKTIVGYDLNDNATSITALGDNTNTVAYDDANHVTYREFDGQNRIKCSMVTSPIPPLTCMGNVASTQYSYDIQGNIKQVRDANNNYTDYSYNGFGELMTQASPDSGTTTYQYNNAGLLKLKTDANGSTVKYLYDSSNRLYAQYFGNNPGENAQDIIYTYDQNDAAHGYGIGRLTQVTDSSGVTDSQYDALGRVGVKTFDPAGSVGALVTKYFYDPVGDLLQVQYPGGRVVDYTRSFGRLTHMNLNYASGARNLDNVAYQPFGGITGFNRHMEINDYINTTRRITADGLLGGIKNTLGSGPFVGLTYTYDAFNNINHIDNDLNPGVSETFEYDTQQRLAKATGLYGRYTYGYDAVGNRQTQMLERAHPATPEIFSEIFNETYTYQPNSNRLSSVSREDSTHNILRARTFNYDADGNRIKDHKVVYQPGTNTVERNEVMAPAYGKTNRMDGIDATNCVTTPNNAACLLLP